MSHLSYDPTVRPPDRLSGTTWVVVGAGSAGCVLAGRLSEGAERVVTLIEAGPDLDRADLDGPIGGGDFLAALDVPDRTFPSLVATRTRGGDSLAYIRGRGVGGSSSVNAMVALRGDPELYRSWGWHDVDAAWAAVALPDEVVRPVPNSASSIVRCWRRHQTHERARLTRRQWPSGHVGRGIAVASARAREPHRACGLTRRPGRVRWPSRDRGASRRRHRRGRRSGGARRRRDPLAGHPAAIRRRHARCRGAGSRTIRRRR